MGACGSKKDTVAPIPGATANAAAATPAAAGGKVVGGDYESAEQLEDFSTFFTDASKSALKKNLT